MKIAIALKFGEDLGARVDERFGRCGLFLFVDREHGEILELLPNENQDAAHGAGVGAAALLSKAGAEAVIAGRYGPKAMQSLEAKGIKMYSAPVRATAAAALEQLRAGGLPEERLRGSWS